MRASFTQACAMGYAYNTSYILQHVLYLTDDILISSAPDARKSSSPPSYNSILFHFNALQNSNALFLCNSISFNPQGLIFTLL